MSKITTNFIRTKFSNAPELYKHFLYALATVDDKSRMIVTNNSIRKALEYLNSKAHSNAFSKKELTDNLKYHRSIYHLLSGHFSLNRNMNRKLEASINKVTNTLMSGIRRHELIKEGEMKPNIIFNLEKLKSEHGGDITIDDLISKLNPTMIYVPKHGDTYWCVNGYGNVIKTAYDADDGTHQHRIKSSNCFRTGNEARIKQNRDYAIYDINLKIDEANSGWVPTDDNVKYAVVYDVKDKRFFITSRTFVITAKVLLFCKCSTKLKHIVDNNVDSLKLIFGVK